MSASGIIVNPSVPAKNLKEFIAYAKANQDNFSYGSAGAGTMTHLAGELFKHLIDTPKICARALQGRRPEHQRPRRRRDPIATINVTGQLLELHESGKVRILAVTSAERLKGAPDFPTAVEAGLPNMVASCSPDCSHRPARRSRSSTRSTRPRRR